MSERVNERERESEYSFLVIVTPWLPVETVTLIASGFQSANG